MSHYQPRRVYDAAYVELALWLNLPLATKYGPPPQAAEAAGIVLFSPASEPL